MEITDISNIDSTQFLNQDYSSKDESLLNSLYISKDFGLPEDKIEVHVISPDGTVIDSTYDFRNYKIVDTTDNSSLYHAIELDPKSDLESFGYFRGQYDINYNFYREIFSSSLASQFYISEISSDRTEIKISSNNISYTDLGQSYLTYIAERNSRAFYSDFLLNFGDNDTYIGVNIALDNINTNVSSLYIKLYEPLPTKITLKNTLWLVETLSDPISFQVVTDFVAEEVVDTTPLRGPNVSIELNEKANLTTPYLNLSTLLNTSVSSSYQQLQSFLDENNVEITIDYTDFSNFIHFSSAVDRVQNFQYKLSQIQSLQNDINSLNNLNISSSINYVVTSKDALQSRIDTIIQKFDGYEYFLYYESGSDSWPKSNSSKPYTNYSTTSPQAKTWLGSTVETSVYYGGKLLEASAYDNNNNDYIWNNLPSYIKEDTQNSNLELFVAMLGQHYDYIWTYVRDITDLQVADNRVDFGISKDLVADTLRNFGMKLYTNSRNQDDIYTSLLGVDAGGSFLPSTGSLLINNYVTASQYTIPGNDIVKETYKRIYHNLPYLLKTKGTRRGLSALINCFGIPETIIKVKEYGGNKKDQDIIEQITPKFDYSFNLGSTASLAIPFQPSYKKFLSSSFNDIYPDTFEYRFKFTGTLPTQSILETSDNKLNIRVTNISSSYAKIDFRISGSSGWTNSTPITLPLYNNDWWNLNLTRQTGSLRASATSSNNTYTLTVGNKDDNGIQYLTSSSLTVSNTYNSVFNTIKTLYPGGNIVTQSFSGSIQEFRYWIGSIPIDDFKDHILNPRSIAYNSVTGSYDNLIFRLPLGSELDNLKTSSLSSVHPSPTASFVSASITSSKAIINNYLSSSYIINHETFLINTPNVGSVTEIDEKVRIADPNLVPGDILTPYISIQKPEIYPYSTDLNVVEVAISPQDSIDADIIDQLGSFNIDDYIGDPRLAASGSYPALTDLRNFYFKKYSKKENIFDLIKLLSYFDNSLFKMIKDFVPAKTNLSTGLVIKPHILERNKIARHEPSLIKVDHSGSIDTAFITGSDGLDLVLNTNFTSSTSYISGSITQYHTDKRELFTGELGGTVITVHSQSLENIVYEFNNLPPSSSQAIYDSLYRLPINPILNNVLQARTTPQYLDIDYAYDPIIPVNNTYLTGSLGNSLRDFHPILDSPVQDSNYTLYRHITPRYNGSKLYGALYNSHSIEDISYGSDPVINLNSVKFAYFNEITSQSLTLPGRSNVNIKYLIDSASSVLELTEANKNLFDVQDIFNRTDANIALENINQPSKQKALNGLNPIYAGGFRYEPILQNITLPNTTGQIKFDLSEPFSEINTSTSGSGTEVSLGASAATIVSPVSLQNPLNVIGLNELRTTYCQTALDSLLQVTLKKNTNTNQDIYHRITGSITLEVYVSPVSQEYPILYSGTNRTGTQYTNTTPGTFSRNPGADGCNPAYWPSWTTNAVQSIYVPARTAIQIATYDPTHASPVIYGPTVVNACVNDYGILCNDSLSQMAWNFTGTYTSIENYNYLNDFSSQINIESLTAIAPDNGSGQTYTSTPLPPGTSNFNKLIDYDNQYGIKVTFYIDAIVKIPGNIPYNQNFITVLLNKNLQPGRIRTAPTFWQYGGAITLKKAPTISFQNVSWPGNYFVYSTPPLFNYIGQFIDNGFLSGSAGVNWFFERGKEGTEYLNLTASYDLSNFYYKHIKTQDNSITQTQYYSGSATSSFSASYSGVGYEDVTTPFFPKKGDIIRFYNHDSNKFPITFEREIFDIIEPINQPLTSSYDNRLVFRFQEPIPNQSCLDYATHIQNLIILSKIPDETNVVVFHDKNPGQTSAGILLPENASKALKDGAGNIVKNLKAQNLI